MSPFPGTIAFSESGIIVGGRPLFLGLSGRACPSSSGAEKRTVRGEGSLAIPRPGDYVFSREVSSPSTNLEAGPPARARRLWTGLLRSWEADIDDGRRSVRPVVVGVHDDDRPKHCEQNHPLLWETELH